MVSKGRGRNSAAETHVVDFMSEFAKYLIAAGISGPKFAAIVRLAYFRAASTQARFSNDRVNQSAVAAMTGLTRVQVRKFTKQRRPLLQEVRDPIDGVMEGWTTDPAYSTIKRGPKRLRVDGKGETFETLARKYGGDIPFRSLLRELERHGLVTRGAGYVSLRRTASRTRQEYRLRSISELLSSLVRTREDARSAALPLRGISMEVKYPACSDKGRLLIQKRAEDGLKNFLSALQESAHSVAMDSTTKPANPGRVARTRVVLVTEDIDG